MPALLTLMAIAILTLTFTGCSDDDDSVTKVTYTYEFSDIQPSNSDFLEEMSKIENTFKSALGITGSPFIKTGTEEECDRQVREACQKAFDSLKDEAWQGDYVFKVMNVGTNKEVYTATFDADNANGMDTKAYVEIGGVKWATMNLGATTVAGHPSTCYGDYYAWGETEPRYTGLTITDAGSVTETGWKSGYSGWGYENLLPSYLGSTLDAKHDAATQNWGSPWRTPKPEEFQSLLKACTGTTWIETLDELATSNPLGGGYWLSSTQDYLPEYKGVAGLLFVDRTDTNKRVFFPAAGLFCYGGFDEGNSYGYYWTSTRPPHGISKPNDCAFDLSFFNSSIVELRNLYRCYGLTIRPVSD